MVDRLLEGGADVRVLDALDPQVHTGIPEYLAQDAEFVRGDVRDHGVVSACMRGVDALVHLAAAVGVAQSMYQIERYASVNTVGAAVVLEEASVRRAALEKVVVASSMAIYGEGLYCCPDHGVVPSGIVRSETQLLRRRWAPACACGVDLEPLPTPETKALEPTSMYAISKRGHEEMFLAWGRAYGVPVTALRFFNVYGPRQALSNPYTGVGAIFAARLLNGRAPILFEDGGQSRDFIHVTDVSDAVMRALAPGRADGLAANVGSGRPVTILEVANTLRATINPALAPEVTNEFRAADIRHCFADVTLAREALGFEPRISFDDGMHDLVCWLVDQNPLDNADEAIRALHRHGLTR